IQNVDAMALWLVTKPEKFGVIVAENMFGDILSDLAGGVMGGLGLAPSGNYGEKIAYFEPVHGSAPGMYGLDRANPSAMYLSISMMLDYLGFDRDAEHVREALRSTLRRATARTYDMGGGAGTKAFAQRTLDVLAGERLRKTAAIVAVGQELVEGEVHNSNSGAIAKHLASAGYLVKEHVCVPDDDHTITRTLQRLLGDVDTILVCGGLGPTADDRTRHAIAAATGRGLVHDDACWAHIEARMTRLGLAVRTEDRVQAQVPEGADVIPNGKGIAYGFSLDHAGTKLIVLPGPPSEMLPMLAETVPADAEGTTGRNRLRWKLLGLIESDVQAFANGLDTDLASRLRTIWQYPYLNIILDIDPADEALAAKVSQLDDFFAEHTVSKDDVSAVEMLRQLPAASWVTEDEELRGILAALPTTETGPRYTIETSPALSQVMRTQAFTGSLEIRCVAPSGRNAAVKAPLRGPEVVDFVREYAAWFQVSDVRAQ
ncbi:MAG TPA: isocitrate/isopropylmalate family dehydrogenase, partial [Saliniramus sp.]|nr:isocitrate/isopropylmalate family dehydrogenase [Saliniramus sp.]